MQDLGRKALLFTQQAQQQVLGPNMFMRKTFGLFSRVCQNPLALIAQRQIDGSGNLLPNRGVTFDLFADRFHRRVGTQEAIGQGFVFA